MGLARTMTLKASAAGLELGGGKAVMIDDGRAELRAARLDDAARVIDGLGGAYITAEDIGTTTADMDLMARVTRFVVGRSLENGGGRPPPRHRRDRLQRDAPRPGRGHRLATTSTAAGWASSAWARSAAGWRRKARGAGATSSGATSSARLRAFCQRGRDRAGALGRGAAGERARRARALRRRRPHGRGARRRSITAAWWPGPPTTRSPSREVARTLAARHPLRARLPRQLRWADPRVEASGDGPGRRRRVEAA